MPDPFPPDLQELVTERMSAGGYRIEDDTLRTAPHALGEDDHDLHAIQEALDDLEAGDPGVPPADAFQSVRERCGAVRERCGVTDLEGRTMDDE